MGPGIAELAASLIPAYARVLDTGGCTGLPAALPIGCRCAVRDPATLGQVSPASQIDIVTVLDPDDGPPPANLLALNLPLLLRTKADRAAEVEAAMLAAGFGLRHSLDDGDGGTIAKWHPAPQAPVQTKRVLVLSYFNTPNFGDRFGYHVVNGLLPAHAEVRHAALNPWTVEEADYDLVILGIGNSVNAPAMRRPELHRILHRARHAIGIFGTQYHYQYQQMMDPRLFGVLLDRLTTWWARYEEDILAFGRGRSNVRHLGDWLISAFPMAVPTLDKTLTIPAKFIEQEIPIDRAIQQIQAYRRVRTARIHPMLCALTSADEVSFTEQREGPDPTKVSGKFRSQLYDVFGRSFTEDQFFRVDRDAVLRYKLKVEANLVELRAQIQALLA